MKSLRRSFPENVEEQRLVLKRVGEYVGTAGV